jgi:hypothetical protein
MYNISTMLGTPVTKLTGIMGLMNNKEHLREILRKELLSKVQEIMYMRAHLGFTRRLLVTGLT